MKQTWQEQLKNAITSPENLLNYLNLQDYSYLISNFAHQEFMTKVPMSFANRMRQGDIHDPLLKQVLPIVNEEKIEPGFVSSPLQEADFNPVPGMLHKYHGRILMTLTPTCAINCRYCFRRHFDYQSNNVGKKGWHKIFMYIQDNPEIHEVILSGGDPLLASNQALHQLTNELEKLKQIKTLRIHTRLPIVLPARVDQDFLSWLNSHRLNTVIVMHSNHPNELNQEVAHACKLLSAAEVTLLNQSVLLKDINDSVTTLEKLSHRLFELKVLPYYLHQLDKVRGAHHFAISDQEALALHQSLTQRLPGYLLPRLVQEVPGAASKTVMV